MTTGSTMLYTRNPSDVEALFLGSLRDLHAAELWLRGHGLDSAHRHPALAARGLLVPTGPGGQFTVARLGQWLVHDLTIGAFSVLDDDDFTALHRPSTLTALVDATRQ